jgi:hypothetical protein
MTCPVMADRRRWGGSFGEELRRFLDSNCTEEVTVEAFISIPLREPNWSCTRPSLGIDLLTREYFTATQPWVWANVRFHAGANGRVCVTKRRAVPPKPSKSLIQKGAHRA